MWYRPKKVVEKMYSTGSANIKEMHKKGDKKYLYQFSGMQAPERWFKNTAKVWNYFDRATNIELFEIGITF